jgi:putative ABC transport system permease protein
MRAFLDELRAAVNGLARAPAFTALAVGVLGLGLGAVIFMYTVADTMMLKPAPYPNSERLYNVGVYLAQDDHYHDGMVREDYLRLRDVQTQFESMGAIYVGTAYLTGDGQAERYDGGFADGDIFDVVGVKPILGRAIEPGDARPGASPVVVLGHALWTERFSADPGVIGRVVRVNGRPSEVVGVMPENYTFPSNADLWVADQEDHARVDRLKAFTAAVYGRLRKDGDLDVAHQEFAPIAAQIAAENPEQDQGGRFEVVPFSYSFMGMDDAPIIWTLLISVGFILVIACANVSNLLLARSAYRVRETTVRSALGASRGRLVTHMLAEGVVITAAATLLGLMLASIGLDGFIAGAGRLMLDSPSWWTFEIDARVATFATAAAFASTLAAGLPAAIRASRPSLDSLLRDGGRTGTGLAIGRIAWGLVVAEVALACAVLGGASLMTRAVLQATSDDVGVRTDDIMTARVGLTAGTYTSDEEQVRFWETLLRRIQEQPGVDAAAITISLPLQGGKESPASIEGRDYGSGNTRPDVDAVVVSPSYFETFRVSAKQGRLLDNRDHKDTMPVVAVSEMMARELWPDESPIGARMRFEFDATRRWYTVVGVVPDIVHDNDGRIDPTVYVPLAQYPQRFMSIAVRGQGEPRALSPAVRKALAETNRDMALYWERTLEESMVYSTAGYRIVGTIFVVFAIVSLVLAAVGLYGVLVFHVRQRTREIGVRRALGADNRRILRLVARTSGTQVLIGIAVGMTALPFIGRGLSNLLLDQNPYDPVIYSLVIALMTAVAVAATLKPTLRALRIDPVAALRYE